MTALDGEDGDMSRPDPATDPLTLDDALTNALIDGRADPSSTSPAYRRVADVVEAASGPIGRTELRGEADAVEMFAREHLARSAPNSLAARRLARSLSKRRVVAALVAGTLVLSGGVAAAATTGSLPAGLQHAAQSLMSRVGVSIPADPPTTEPSSEDGPGGQRQDPAKPDPVSLSDCAKTDPPACEGQDQGQSSTQGEAEGDTQDQTHGSDADHSSTSSVPSGETDHGPPTSVGHQGKPVAPNKGHGSTSTSHVPHGKGTTTTTVGG